MPILRAEMVRISGLPTDPQDVATVQKVENTILASHFPMKYEFRRDNGIPASQTNTVIWEHKGQFDSIKLQDAGYFVRAQARLTSAITAGTLDIKYRLTRGANPPAIIVSSGASLDLSLASTDDYKIASVDRTIPEYVMQADDKIEVLATTSGTFAPTTAAFEVILTFMILGE